MTKGRHIFLVTILGLMVAVGPFSIDMYLPAFQVIANEFKTSISNVSLSMATYFVGMAVGQLLYGPLLDRFGRKPPLYIGLAIYVIYSILCITADSIDDLISYRFLQAVGGCASSVAAFAIVRDIFPVKDNAKIFSSLMLVISASPIIAPSLGGFASLAWGWQSVFIILTAIAIIIVLLVFFGIPESKGPDPSYSLMPLPILRSFGVVFREPQFFTYAFAGGIAFAGLFVFVSSSPFLFLGVYGLDEKQYGILFAVMVGGMIVASQVNRLLLRTNTSEKLVSWAIGIQVVTALVLLAVALLGMESFYVHVGLLMIFLATVGIIMPNGSALTLAPFSQNTGTASAMLGALQLGFGALASFIVSVSMKTSSMPMTVAMCICSVGALAALLIGRPFIKETIAGNSTAPIAH